MGKKNKCVFEKLEGQTFHVFVFFKGKLTIVLFLVTFTVKPMEAELLFHRSLLCVFDCNFDY